MATGGLVPDLTLLLTLPPERGSGARDARGGHDRMERAELAFHERVARAFDAFATPEWQRAHPECGPIVLSTRGQPRAKCSTRVRDGAARALARNFPSMS